MPPDVPADTGAPIPPGDGKTRWQIQFWALQVLELGVAFLLVTQSVHVGRGRLLVAAGVALGLLALTADGPLGVFRVCGQRLHVALVVATASAMAVAAFVPILRPDVEGLLVIGGAVVALVLLATRTIITPGKRGRRRRSAGAGARGPVIDTTATVVVSKDAASGADAGVSDGADSALRRAGRTTGSAAAAGKRAVDEHRPQVEVRVKRTLRGAGRLAGKLAAGKSPPTDPSA